MLIGQLSLQISIERCLTCKEKITFHSLTDILSFKQNPKFLSNLDIINWRQSMHHLTRRWFFLTFLLIFFTLLWRTVPFMFLNVFVINWLRYAGFFVLGHYLKRSSFGTEQRTLGLGHQIKYDWILVNLHSCIATVQNFSRFWGWNEQWARFARCQVINELWKVYRRLLAYQNLVAYVTTFCPNLQLYSTSVFIRFNEQEQAWLMPCSKTSQQ